MDSKQLCSNTQKEINHTSAAKDELLQQEANTEQVLYSCQENQNSGQEGEEQVSPKKADLFEVKNAKTGFLSAFIEAQKGRAQNIEVTDAIANKYKDSSLSALRDEFKTDSRYVRKGFFGGVKSDSKEMTNIMTNLDALITVLTQKVESADLEVGMEYIGSAYLQIIDFCNRYLSRSLGKGKYTEVGINRRQMVERIRTTCMRESNLLEDIVKNTAARVAEGEHVEALSWGEMLRQCRSQHLSKGNGADFSIVGAGQSTVIRIKNDNKVTFFKEDEVLKKSTNADRVAMVEATMDTLVDTGELTQEQASFANKCVSDVLDALHRDIEGVTVDEAFGSDLLEALKGFSLDTNEMFIFYSELQNEPIQNRPALIEEFIDMQYLNAKKAVYKDFDMPEFFRANAEVFAVLRNNMKKVFTRFMHVSQAGLLDVKSHQAVDEAYKVISKDTKAYAILTRSVKLPEGAKVTTNNVATSRVAGLLGVSELVAKSSSAVVTIEGKTKMGNLMEEAKGRHIYEFFPKRKNQPPISRLSGNAKKQLVSLGILDYIMGQIDRHQGNFLVTEQNIGGVSTITGIKGIDNDACCGLLAPKDVQKKGKWNRLYALQDAEGNVKLPYIDRAFAESILALSVQDLAYNMLDLLSAEQIKAMVSRLNDVKKLIKSEYHKSENNENSLQFLETDEEWEDATDVSDKNLSLSAYNPLFFNKSIVW